MSLSGHQDSSREEHWWFGALCEQCGHYVPGGRDPTEGKTGARFPLSGCVTDSAACAATDDQLEPRARSEWTNRPPDLPHL